MATLRELEREVEKIKARNRSVESEKAWETSWTRRSIIAVFTYLSVALYLYAINVSLPFLNAIVPTAGFLLSTLTMPFFRRMWLNRRKG